MVIFHLRLAVPATHVLLYISLVTGPGTFAAAACHGISAAWMESARISLDTLREMHGILLFLYLYIFVFIITIIIIIIMCLLIDGST